MVCSRLTGRSFSRRWIIPATSIPDREAVGPIMPQSRDEWCLRRKAHAFLHGIVLGLKDNMCTCSHRILLMGYGSSELASTVATDPLLVASAHRTNKMTDHTAGA